MKKTLEEFKAFALRGNVVDMAIGVIIGGAFGKIVSSLVSDILMPALGSLIGGMNFSHLKLVIKEAVKDGDKVVTPEVAISYGNFIQATFDFFIIAFSIFIMIKIISRIFTKAEEEKKVEEAAPPAPPADIQLLTEIRDLLKEKKNS